jgi:hypothetical protein
MSTLPFGIRIEHCDPDFINGDICWDEGSITAACAVISACHTLKHVSWSRIYEARLNIIQEFSPYRKENTEPHRYKDQPVNAV